MRIELVHPILIHFTVGLLVTGVAAGWAGQLLKRLSLLWAGRWMIWIGTAFAIAAAWFGEPLSVLGGQTPLDLCATEAGAREVEQTLGRIEHGVFA